MRARRTGYREREVYDGDLITKVARFDKSSVPYSHIKQTASVTSCATIEDEPIVPRNVSHTPIMGNH